eukprot:comp19567_c0_seq1/m.22978 comp19567_c0_seq1/g.22978  ORF comp19567_c0_seq1/g.22978 comp19567_c0_seq1/m.22978 type:complete len:311 (-) comp19567_c0_seq1:463-1395(-)
MAMDSAKTSFLKSLERLQGHDLEEFCRWAREVVDEAEGGNKDGEWEEDDSDAIQAIESIIADLRQALPTHAMAPQEKTFVPKTGENAGSDDTNTIHVDSFLFDDDEVDRLVEEGKMSRAYCLDCGSKNTKMLNFVSHSASVGQLQFIFQKALPDLTGKHVVDVGSRIGAVLYGGYHFSEASKLTGVELNGHLCDVTRQMVQKHNMGDRIEVIAGDMLNHGSLLQSADVVVLNNVFEFFHDHTAQSKFWKFLRDTLTKKGMYLVTIPSLEESLANAEAKVDLQRWVREVAVDYDDFDEESDVRMVHVYRVR